MLPIVAILIPMCYNPNHSENILFSSGYSGVIGNREEDDK